MGLLKDVAPPWPVTGRERTVYVVPHFGKKHPTIEAREKAKKEFKNIAQVKKPWVELIERYDNGEFPLRPTALKEDQ
jgi:hypothetical protein